MLARAEANGLLPHFCNEGYPMLHTLTQACRLSASRVQAAMDRLGLVALAPAAMALVQGSSQQYQSGDSGEGATDARELCLELRQQMAYKPKLQAVPWGLVQNGTFEQGIIAAAC